MMFVRHGPLWFRIATIVLVVWAIIGCFACLQQLRLGAAAMGPPSAYDVALYARLPGWYDPLFALSVLAGLGGAVLLYMRRYRARVFQIVSLVAIIVQFGWLFVATDIVAHKGAGSALGFPFVIFAIAVFALWLTGHAKAKGWVG